MKIAFIGGALDHISLPLSEAFYSLVGDDFSFVASKEFCSSRRNLGYDSLNNQYNFVVKAYENEQTALKVIDDADVVIYGSAPEKLIKDRIKKNKLTFRFTERLAKEPTTVKNFAHRFLSIIKHHLNCQRKKVYVLCASAYASKDFASFKCYKNKCFKWGYFTKVSDKSYDELLGLKEKNKKTQLIWTARFIELKHPEIVVKLAKFLKEKGVDFTISMLGGGDLIEKTKDLVNKLEVNELVEVLGPVCPEKTCELMEKADISLFTSDRREGWGAVVNEAMGSGCAVIASRSAGSPPFLIEDGENGLLFDINNEQEFFDKVYSIIINKQKQREFGKKAYQSVQTLWTAENAAKSFISLTQSILDGKLLPCEKGPCSIAPILKDGGKY